MRHQPGLRRFPGRTAHDAEDIADALEILVGPPEKVAAFEVLGYTGTWSFVAFWQMPGAPMGQRPVVWLDSEGSPYGVFASSLADFLTVLPFGNGLLKSTLSFCTGEHPRAHLLDVPQLAQELVPHSIAFMQEYYPGREAYLTWLSQTAGLFVAENPVARIVQAYQSHPELAEWLGR